MITNMEGGRSLHSPMYSVQTLCGLPMDFTQTFEIRTPTFTCLESEWSPHGVQVNLLRLTESMRTSLNRN